MATAPQALAAQAELGFTSLAISCYASQAKARFVVPISHRAVHKPNYALKRTVREEVSNPNPTLRPAQPLSLGVRHFIMMQAFGYAVGSSGKSTDIIPLESVHLAMAPEVLDRFAEFVARAAQEMRLLGPEQFDHKHFGDFYVKGWEQGWPDIQLTRVFSA